MRRLDHRGLVNLVFLGSTLTQPEPAIRKILHSKNLLVAAYKPVAIRNRRKRGDWHCPPFGACDHASDVKDLFTFEPFHPRRPLPLGVAHYEQLVVNNLIKILFLPQRVAP